MGRRRPHMYAGLTNIVEHDVLRRTPPFDPAVRAGLGPELDRTVGVPGVRPKDGPGDRFAFDVDDSDAKRQTPAPPVGMTTGAVCVRTRTSWNWGAKPSAWTVMIVGPAVAVLQGELTLFVCRSRRRPGTPRCRGR